MNFLTTHSYTKSTQGGDTNTDNCTAKVRDKHSFTQHYREQ